MYWDHAPVDCAHPLDDGTAALMYRSIDATVDGLGRDGRRWRALVGPLASRFDDLAAEVMRPIAHVPGICSPSRHWVHELCHRRR